MRILFTTPFVPYPPTYGGAIIPYSHLQGLANRGHAMVMVFPLRRPGDEDAIPILSEFGKVRTVRVSVKSPAQFAAEALATGTSLRVSRHRFVAVEREVAGVLSKDKFDIVYLDSFFTTYLLPQIRRSAPRTPVVLLTQNLESQVMRRLVDQRPNRLLRLVSLAEIPLLERNERHVHEHLDKVVTLSDLDAAAIRATAPRARTVVLGPGTPTYPGASIPRPTERTVLFLGAYQWPPNLDAAKWMAREIWPRVRERTPGARLILAGHDPTGTVKLLANERAGVVVPGFVEDATEITRSAWVCVAPLRIAGGVRLKIIEALANERPVVTTTIGAEGLGLRPGEHAHFADDATSFADAVSSLLQDESKAVRSAQLGRKYVEETFSWPRVIERLEAVLEGTVREGRR
jgi:glycosyltransferase involved in cell wall biosynthesis